MKSYAKKMPIVRQIVFRVPRDFDLDAHFAGADRFYAAYLLDLLYWHLITRRDEGFKRLKREFLVRFIPARKLTKIRRILAQLGVIEVNHTYEVGKRSKSYRLCPTYVRSRSLPCRHAELAAKIRKWRLGRRQLQRVHRWLRDNLNILEVNVARARGIIATMLPKAGSKMGVEEYRELAAEVFDRLCCHRTDHFTVCDYGRVHSLITSLPKKLRCCLTVDGVPLVGIDLVNSQPLLLAIVAKRWWESPDARHRVRERDFATRRTPYVTQELVGIRRREAGEGDRRGSTRKCLPIMSCAAAESAGKRGQSERRRVQNGGFPADLAAYQELCERGQIYEHLQGPNESREDAKRHLFIVFYGRLGGWDPLVRQLESEFPTVAKVMRALKRDKYKHLARLMQSYESTMIIAIICERIRRERPGIALYTIHDSVLITAPHVEYVKGVIRDEFSKIGVVPLLSEERYA